MLKLSLEKAVGTIREMHELFADSLFKMIFADEPEILEEYNNK